MGMERNDEKDWIYAYASNGKKVKGAKVIYDENHIPIKAEVKLQNKTYINIPVEELRTKLNI